MQSYIMHGNTKIDFVIVRKKRKTIGISVSMEHGVRVSAPNWTSKQQIRQVVLQKVDWILDKLQRLQEQKRYVKQYKFVTGEYFPYQGKEYQLEVLERTGGKPAVDNEHGKIRVFIPAGMKPEEQGEVVREALVGWYKRQAAPHISGRMEAYAAKIGAVPSKVLIKEQKRIWGSCTRKGTININWKILMAPPPVIDYLVVHEMAHLKEMNHSKNFWDLVESVLPDYKTHLQWLKKNTARMNF